MPFRDLLGTSPPPDLPDHRFPRLKSLSGGTYPASSRRNRQPGDAALPVGSILQGQRPAMPFRDLPAEH